MINYAHRGASEYAPENTLSSFYLGLLQGANGIEMDVQKTKDGEIVVFHDDTVDRVTNGTGKVSDFTLKELKNLKVFGNSTNNFYDKIITLEEFLVHFSRYNIKFAIELKGEGIESGTLQMVLDEGVLDKVTFTSFNFEYLKTIKELNNEARIGWLVKNPSDEDIAKFLDIGGEEIAPLASNIDSMLISKLRNLGLGIRAWGVSNVQTMKAMYDIGVDGMTVNFPDRLYQYMLTKKLP